MENTQPTAQTNDDMSLESLVIRAKNKDSYAISYLYQLSQPRIRQAVSSIIHDSYEIEDLMQDSFLLSMERLDQLHQPGAYLEWVTQIARNQAKNHSAKKQPIRFTDMEDEDGSLPEALTQSQAPSLEDSLERGEIAAAVNNILSTLSDSERTAICFYYYDQFSVEEIAEKMRVSSSSVRVLMHRGRKKAAARIRTLEKQGMRLYGLEPIPFLLMLMKKLRTGEDGAPTPPAIPGSGIGSAAASAVQAAAGAGAIKAGSSVAEAFALTGILTKVGILLTAAALFIGIGAGIYAVVNSQNREQTPGTEPVSEQAAAAVSAPVESHSQEARETESEALILTTATTEAATTTEIIELPKTETISLYESAIQGLLEVETTYSSNMEGRLYDLNGDGIRELILLYEKMMPFEDGPFMDSYVFCSVYTQSGDDVVPLLEDEKILMLAATANAFVEIAEINGEEKLILWADGCPTPYPENRKLLQIEHLFTVYSFDGAQLSVDSRNQYVSVWSNAEGGFGTDQFMEDLSYCILDGRISDEIINTSFRVPDVMGERQSYASYRDWRESVSVLCSFRNCEFNGLFNATPAELLESFQSPQQLP